jgi:hypothetical protein
MSPSDFGLLARLGAPIERLAPRPAGKQPERPVLKLSAVDQE